MAAETAIEPPAPVPPGRLRRAVVARVGGLPGAFWVLFAGTLINRLGGFVEPFLAVWLSGPRGLEPRAIGLVLSAFGAGALLSQPLGGAIADRLGRKVALVGGMVGTAAGLAVLALSPGQASLVVVAFLLGVAVDVYRPASSAMVTDLVPSADRPRAFGLLFWAINLGFAGTGVLAGFLAARGFGLLFVGDALTCLAFAALVAWRIPETLPRDGPVAAERRGRLADVLADRVFLALVALTFAYACVYFQVFATVPLVARERGLPIAAYGVALATNGVVIVVLQPLVSGWLGRRRKEVVLAGAFLLVGLGFGATALVSEGWQLAATVAVWTLGEIAWAAVMPATVADLAPLDLRGRYQGVFGIAFGAAAVAAPAVGTAVLAAAGPAWLFGGCLAVGVGLAAAQLALGPALARRLAVAAEQEAGSPA